MSAQIIDAAMAALLPYVANYSRRLDVARLSDAVRLLARQLNLPDQGASAERLTFDAHHLTRIIDLLLSNGSLEIDVTTIVDTTLPTPDQLAARAA